VWKGPGDLDEARRSERRFEPVMEAAQRDALYAGWQQAVGRVRSPGNRHV
jgi:glycerol kinase